jgi:signal transduction histidine kinase
LLGALIIGTLGLLLTEIAYLGTHYYFPALPVVIAAIIALYSGYRLALIAGALLALVADYRYVPPIGSVLDSPEGFLHLFVILTLTALVCLMVTALRLAYSRMWQARQAAEKAKKDMEQVLSVVSHDLRNPISIARAGAETLQRFKTDSERANLIERGIIEAMDRADAMIRDLLDQHQLQKGKSSKKTVNVNQLAGQLIRELSLVHGDRFELQAPADVRGQWSLQDLRRVIENLVGNAVKYGAPDQKITLRVEQVANEVRISVHNLGEPLSPERQSQLFRRDQRSERPGSLKQEGWGIGLVSVSHIVDSYGGRITVESSREKGTWFIVSLPLLSGI